MLTIRCSSASAAAARRTVVSAVGDMLSGVKKNPRNPEYAEESPVPSMPAIPFIARPEGHLLPILAANPVPAPAPCPVRWTNFPQKTEAMAPQPPNTGGSTSGARWSASCGRDRIIPPAPRRTRGTPPRAGEGTGERSNATMQPESPPTDVAQLQSVFDLAPIGIANVGPDGRFLRVNAAFQRLLGYTADELQARTFSEVTHPDDREMNDALVRELAEGKRAH